MDKRAFSQRLAALRIQKGISARDMSLSLGQSAGYINNIENGVNFPSMSMFFLICDFLNVSERDFFDADLPSPSKARELSEACRGLSDDQLQNLIALIRDLKK
ncbi:MAG: helix-turn-helix transcriptional regulator [Clostridia bacterium]|nr:helix-turn-helix transcriptional regulator [Clostridia bacterium]MBR4442015.1 helix-turn-helix transcriptional regulator [Clostridia bacterium]